MTGREAAELTVPAVAGRRRPGAQAALGRLRLGAASGRGRRLRATAERTCGAYVASRPVVDRARDLALDASLRTSALFPRRPGATRLHPDGLCDKVREQRVGLSLLFAVDGSGSMRCEQGMGRAKALVQEMLTDAYRQRDRIGLVTFRGGRAELVLPLGARPALARRALAALPAGGRTPLAEGLRLGLKALLRERAQHPGCLPLLVVLSDGKPTATARGDPDVAALGAARAVGRSGVGLLFVDTDRTWHEPGLGRRIARLAGGHYALVERAGPIDLLRALALLQKR